MSRPLNLLLVEDNPDDAELLQLQLRRAGLELKLQRVDTEEAYLAALSPDLDLILSDYQMPQFTGLRALELLRWRELEVPFIIISGTIGEETAVEAMRLGAVDYLLKDRLGRLGVAVLRAIDDARLRRERRKIEADFRVLFKDNPMPMWVYDLETLRFLAVNNAAVHHYGYSRDEFLSLTLKDIRPREDVEALMESQRRKPEGLDRAGHWRHCRKDGSVIVVEITTHALTFAGRAAELVLANDVTQRQASEAALRESEERFRQVVENIHEVFWLSDVAKNRIIYVSPGYEQIWGRKCEELYRSPRTWLENIDPRDRERVAQAATTKQASGDYDETYRIVRPDGKTRWIRDRAYPVRQKDGHMARVVGVAEDVTEQKELEEQFFRAQRMEAIGTLAGGLAHDLNNILAPVMMIAGLLKEKLTSPRDIESLRMVEGSTQRGAGIIRQLLSFSRGLSRERVPVQMRHLIRETGDITRETFPRGINIHVDAPAGLWTVNGDATQLHQVLLNLCVNARDAMPRGGDLTIRAQNVELDEFEARRRSPAHPGRYVLLTVTDTGDGIPPEIIDRIFDPFFTTKTEGKGTGLGLSSVLGITKAHGGVVTVQSEFGKGTEFSVYLPANEEGGRREEGLKPSEIAAGRGETILVVDDEADVRAATVLLLERQHYAVMTAKNGRDALTVFMQHADRVALLLTDVMMPEMDGIALIRGIRALKPDIKVIAMTGLDEEANRAELQAAGVAHVVQKPYALSELLGTVQRCLQQT